MITAQKNKLVVKQASQAYLAALYYVSELVSLESVIRPILRYNGAEIHSHRDIPAIPYFACKTAVNREK